MEIQINHAPSIALKQLGVKVDRAQLLEPFDLNIERGAWFGLVGPNGGGKSTLLKSIAGLIPYQGDVFINWPTHTRGCIGYVPQCVSRDTSLPLSVYDYLRIHCERRPVWRRRKRNEQLENYIDRLNISSLLETKLGALSTGERQKVMLCATLSNSPDILLLDEPLAGVDKAGQAQLLAVLNQFHESGGTILMVEHNWNVIAQYCQRIAWIQGGLKMEEAPQQVLHHLGQALSPFDFQLEN